MAVEQANLGNEDMRNVCGSYINIFPFTTGRELAEYDAGERTELSDRANDFLKDMTDPTHIRVDVEDGMYEIGSVKEWSGGLPCGPYEIDVFRAIKGYWKVYERNSTSNEVA